MTPTPPVAQGMVISTDGRPVWIVKHADGTTVIFYPPKAATQLGVYTQITLADCVQALYAPDGSLLATFNEESDPPLTGPWATAGGDFR